MAPGRERDSSDAPAGGGLRTLRLSVHVVAAIAIGLIAPFTGLAWPFAILVGIVIGKSQVRRAQGLPTARSVAAIEVLAVTGGVLSMMYFGAILGGIISFFVAAIAAASENEAGHASPSDRLLARGIVAIGAVLVWLLLAVVLRLNLSVQIGG